MSTCALGFFAMDGYHMMDKGWKTAAVTAMISSA